MNAVEGKDHKSGSGNFCSNDAGQEGQESEHVEVLSDEKVRSVDGHLVYKHDTCCKYEGHEPN